MIVFCYHVGATAEDINNYTTLIATIFPFFTFLVLLLGSLITIFAVRRRKRVDIILENSNYYEEIDDRGYTSLNARVREVETDFGGGEITDDHSYDIIEDDNCDQLLEVPTNQRILASTLISDHHDYESIDKKVKIFDVSRTHHVYDQPEVIASTGILSFHGRTHACEQVLGVGVTQILTSAEGGCRRADHSSALPVQNCSEREVYEHAQSVDVLQNATSSFGGNISEREAIYECAPSVHIVQANANCTFLESIYESEGSQVYERVPNVDIAQILSVAASIYDRAKFYERVPNVNIAPIKNATETSQTYEQVPNVNIIQLIEAASLQGQTYEQVQNVDIAQLLEAASLQAWAYEQVPNVDISQLLLSSTTRSKGILTTGEEIYEQVPQIDLAEILSKVGGNSPSSDTMHKGAQISKRVPNIAVLNATNVSISGEERVEQVSNIDIEQTLS